MLEGIVENGEFFNTDEIDFVRVEKHGIIFKKPFSLCLFTLNLYEHLLPGDILDAPIPARIPFVQENCVICMTNKPNILYSSCWHMCICRSCDRSHPINKCPLCRRGAASKFYLCHYQIILYIF